GSGRPPPRVSRVITRWDWRILSVIPRIARREAWDVLHIQYQPGAFALHPAINLLPGWLAARRRGALPVVVTTFHDLRVPYLFPKAGRLRLATVRHLARTSPGIIAASANDVRDLTEWTRPLRRPPAIAHISLGNQLDTPPPSDFDRSAWRARLGLPADALLAGHFGFVNRSKAIDALLDAVAQLTGEGRDLHLLMIGDLLGTSDPTNADYLAEMRRLADALGVSERVRWTGRCPPEAVAAWLRCLDVAVLPFRDGVSLRRTSIIAAWSNEVPVVTTAPDQDGVSTVAVVVPLATAPSLAGALRDLLDRPTRRRALGAAGARFAARFAWPAVATQTEALYHTALTGAGHGQAGG
ncbi:MAG: glycosyltransferase, partial [Chloroflexota bacterium]|nr:glycosyltransferase [Chloroflexota bacterium]